MARPSHSFWQKLADWLNWHLVFFSNKNNLGFHMRYHMGRNFGDYPGFQPQQPLCTILNMTVGLEFSFVAKIAEMSRENAGV